MKRLSLLARFSLLSLLLFTAIGLSLGFGLTRYFQEQELERQKLATAALMQPAVGAFLNRQILDKGAFGSDYKGIEYALSYLGGAGLVRIKIWNKDGMVIYSDDQKMVGQRFPLSDELKSALEGITSGELSNLDKEENRTERGYGELMEVYTPLRLGGENDISGAFEGYYDVQDLRSLLNSTALFIWTSIGSGFMALYLSLFAIVRGASQRIINQSQENALLLADTQRKAARLQTINELARSINRSTLDLDMVFRTALRGIERIAPDAEAAIIVQDERTGASLHRVMSRSGSALEQAIAHLDLQAESPERAGHTSEAIVCNDTRNPQANTLGLPAEMGVRSYLVTPISLGERRLGVLFVAGAEPNIFDEDDAAIAKGVADQLAVAIENTRLIKETAETTALRETNRLKDEFVSMVSHELRTPLASIKGYSHTLLSAEDWDEQTRSEFLGIIADESDKLTDLVENLLEMSRIGAGRLPIMPEPVLLSKFCGKVVERISKHYPETHFICDMDEPLPVVEADPRRVEQVLINLLQNAAKYSGSKWVRVEGSFDGGREVVISVSDGGKGIAPEHLPHLFDKFYRVENGGGGNGTGTGLGLAIAKALVEAMGGKIWVRSTPGKGAAFYFTLPALVLQGEGGGGGGGGGRGGTNEAGPAARAAREAAKSPA